MSNTIKTLTTYVVTFPVGTHKLPVSVAAVDKGEAVKLATPILRTRINHPTYGGLPTSIVEKPAKVGAGAIATNPTVTKPRNKR
jgi:hypothetical protein